MAATNDNLIHQLTAPTLGEARAARLIAAMVFAPELVRAGPSVSRAQAAMALNVLLYARLLDEVPTAARYFERLTGQGGTVTFDHGALRTIDGETGTLPRGHLAFARLLEPLGYVVGGTYPLPRLKMTGRAFVQQDMPEAIPQFFVSELHVSELPAGAQAAAARVFGASRDPLGVAAKALLDLLAHYGSAPIDIALAGLPGIAAAFGRHHPEPALADYESLRAATSEGAWIATEGNAFNHATDRVADVAAHADGLRAAGFPLKVEVEHSANGRVHQTAFIADQVTRSFRDETGALVTREVPGSFYEFITRDVDPATGALDLTFDSGNATGIFAVTAGR